MKFLNHTFNSLIFSLLLFSPSTILFAMDSDGEADLELSQIVFNAERDTSPSPNARDFLRSRGGSTTNFRKSAQSAIDALMAVQSKTPDYTLRAPYVPKKRGSEEDAHDEEAKRRRLSRAASAPHIDGQSHSLCSPAGTHHQPHFPFGSVPPHHLLPSPAPSSIVTSPESDYGAQSAVSYIGSLTTPTELQAVFFAGATQTRSLPPHPHTQHSPFPFLQQSGCQPNRMPALQEEEEEEEEEEEVDDDDENLGGEMDQS